MTSDVRSPKISVYVVSRDYGRFLSEAIESVLRQHYDDWELLLIDDASSDNTADVMRLYVGDPRVRTFTTTGIGLPAV
jgi:glycosyltransferase involved in cell wall biosynthesis